MFNLLVYPGLPNNIRKIVKLASQEDFDRDPNHIVAVIIGKVCSFFEITSSELKSQSRKKELVWARCIVAYALKENTGFSLKKIGEILGGRDHSTVSYQLDQYRDLSEFDKPFKNVIKQIDL